MAAKVKLSLSTFVRIARPAPPNPPALGSHTHDRTDIVMPCSTGCPTQDHASYGECMRAKRPRTADVAYTVANKKHTSELNAYAAARRQGIQPRSTRLRHIEGAVRESERTGTAYDAGAA